jgi:CAAX protease family protein
MVLPAREPAPEGDQEARKAGPSRREQWRETLVFLFLIVPSMGLSFFEVRQGNLSFVLVAVATILRDLSFVALIGFFLWRNRERWGRIGMKIEGGWNEVLLGAALFIPVFLGAGLLERLFRSMGLSAPPTPQPRFLTATGSKELVLGAVLVTVVAFSEEIIFRGYLIDRLSNVTRSTAAAVLLSSFIFSLGHGYEGTAGVATVGVLGLIFALVYLWRANLVAPIVMHFLQDFIGIVMVPLLRHR